MFEKKSVMFLYAALVSKQEDFKNAWCVHQSMQCILYHFKQGT